MATNRMTKDDMQDCLDQVTDILSDPYQPESDRETLAAAIGDALQLLDPDTYGDGADDTDGDDSDDGDDDRGN